MDKRQRLAELIERPGVVVVPGVYDALTARIAERAGFEAIFATGAGISNAHLGLGDVGLLTVDELLRTIKPMCEGMKIPLIVDADTGFGGYLNVQRTVRELEHAGAAAITLEDQMFPKRCGHFRGKRMVAVGGRQGRHADARRWNPPWLGHRQGDSARRRNGVRRACTAMRHYVGRHAIGLLHSEVGRVLALLGCPSVAQLGPQFLTRRAQ